MKMYEDKYQRDDGWTIDIVHDGTVVYLMSHLPTITTDPPDPVTVEYAIRAMSAHGYVKVDNCTK